MRTSGAASIPRLPGDARLRRVLFAYGLSRFTEFAGWLAVLLVAYHLGGAGLIGISAFVMQAPTIALVPVLAGFADRMPRGRALMLVPCRGGRVHCPGGRPAARRRPLVAGPGRRRS